MGVPANLAFLENISWRDCMTELADGRRSYIVDVPTRAVRCQFPCVEDFDAIDRLSAHRAALDLGDIQTRVFDDSGEGIDLGPDSTGDTGSDDEVDISQGEGALLSGVASSTSRDFFGTEMSLRALKGMAVQMMGGMGISYIPRHNRGWDALEWNETIGRTIHAEVVPVEAVASASNPLEPQFMLRVTVQLVPVPENAAERDESERNAAALIKRLSRGELIGQSIGGWFTRLELIENKDGDIERVIVHGVELDHLAVTRAPANPDSIGLVQLRSCASELLRSMRAAEDSAPNAAPAPAVPDMQMRHVLSQAETEYTVVYQFLKSGIEADDVPDDEIIGNISGSDDSKGSDDEVEEPANTIIDLAEDSAPDVRDESDAGDSLDTEGATAQDEVESGNARSDDARRSAPDVPPPAGEPAKSEERDMLTAEDLRAMLDEKLDPLKAKIEEIDQRTAAGATPNPIEEPPVPAEDPHVAELRSKIEEIEARATAAEKRAKDAEGVVAQMVAGGSHRIGRSAVHLSIGNPVAAPSVFDGVIGRAKDSAPTLAKICERSKNILLGKNGDLGRHATRSELTGLLNALCNGAEYDAVITPPGQRAAWQ